MDFLYITPNRIGQILLSGLIIYIIVIIYTRIAGLRSFSKMSSFDFVITLAIGSTVPQVLMAKSPAIMDGAIALGLLYFLKMAVAFIVSKYHWADIFFNNQPLMLMEGENIYYDNLKKARVSEANLMASLRQADVVNFRDVKVVVLEPNGEMTVIHDPYQEKDMNPLLLKNVRRS